MKRGKFKFLKLLNEYRSINYELKYVRDVLEDVHLEFDVFYRTWCVENNVASSTISLLPRSILKNCTVM